MTEKELTEWEHRSDVIKVLTSYEMGAWLHRRDKRLLQEIYDEIDARRENLKILADDDLYADEIKGYNCVIEIIDKYRGSEDKG